MHRARGKRVYIASALGTPEKWPDNIRSAAIAWEGLTEAGFFAYCPHINVHYHTYSQYAGDLDYEFWLAYDISWLDTCDYLLRLPGHSPGADREVEYAKANKIIVVHSIYELIELDSRKCECQFCQGTL